MTLSVRTSMNIVSLMLGTITPFILNDPSALVGVIRFLKILAMRSAVTASSSLLRPKAAKSRISAGVILKACPPCRSSFSSLLDLSRSFNLSSGDLKYFVLSLLLPALSFLVAGFYPVVVTIWLLVPSVHCCLFACLITSSFIGIFCSPNISVS